ncbi:MAG: HpcH/HpaI aldolase/citrate lyase family protein [Campylobacterota bacterium]|nr:HpcH/HpaI aldolase/citrate lyase family protein [Campylobacterota bacterium]
MQVDYTELGATLFVPATHKDLMAVVEGKKYPNLKSVVIDSEDAISNDELLDAIKNIKKILINFKNSKCLVFIRPRDCEVLKKFLTFKGIDKIDGFILPKFSLLNANKYLTLIRDKYRFMPSIEGEELFNHSQLIKLKDILLPHKKQIILVRFGLEDMLRQLGMKRGCKHSLFDFSASSLVVGNFIATFKSVGFKVSAGVYPCFKDSKGFEKDVLRDLKEGLFSKTIIHPNQIELINELYKVTWLEFSEACEIYMSTDSVFKQNDKMAEVVTMLPYSQEIIKRAEVYGIKD